VHFDTGFVCLANVELVALCHSQRNSKYYKKQNSNTLLNIPPYNNIILFFDDTPDKIFQKGKEGKLLAPCY